MIFSDLIFLNIEIMMLTCSQHANMSIRVIIAHIQLDHKESQDNISLPQ